MSRELPKPRKKGIQWCLDVLKWLIIAAGIAAFLIVGRDGGPKKRITEALERHRQRQAGYFTVTVTSQDRIVWQTKTAVDVIFEHERNCTLVKFVQDGKTNEFHAWLTTVTVNYP